MSKTRIIKPSADAMVKMMRRVKIPETVAYETVKSTTSRMDYPYAHVLKHYSFSYVPASVPQQHDNYWEAVFQPRTAATRALDSIPLVC